MVPPPSSCPSLPIQVPKPHHLFSGTCKSLLSPSFPPISSPSVSHQTQVRWSLPSECIPVPHLYDSFSGPVAVFFSSQFFTFCLPPNPYATLQTHPSPPSPRQLLLSSGGLLSLLLLSPPDGLPRFFSCVSSVCSLLHS